MNRIIMHIDVNNAFLSWSAIDLLNNGYKYDIRNSYAVIGGDEKTRNGIVLAKSTPAKRMGIYTSETLYSARKKCPALKCYPPNYKFYSEMSNKLFMLLNKYTPDIEIASIDECYLDYTPVKNIYGDELEFARKIQKEIFDTLKFTVNIGIANSKLCAKMASDFEKPFKIHTLYDTEIKDKMWPLPVGDLFGIGKKSTEKLINLGIRTIKDLAFTDPNYLSKHFKNQAIVMINSANGIDNSRVVSVKENSKSIGNEITLEHDVSNKDELKQQLLYISDKVGRRLRNANKYAYVVVLVLKDKYFIRKSRQKKLDNPTNITEDIYNVSVDLLNGIDDMEPVRLIGIQLTNLVDTCDYQVSLFESMDNYENDGVLDKTIDKLKDKYGSSILKKASLIKLKEEKRLHDN